MSSVDELQKIAEPTISVKETLIQDYFQPCRDAAKVYELHRETLRQEGKFKEGEFLPLDLDQKTLKKIYRKGNRQLKFTGPIDVYNNTKPFLSNGETYIAARVEPRDLNFHSKVVFFKKISEKWIAQEEPTFGLEDPFITTINGELVFGGVQTFTDGQGNFTGLQTVLYKGKSLNDLKEFARGPVGQKDIRLIGLKDGRIGIFTRPQTGKFGRGQIGFTIVDSLDMVNEQVITEAPLLKEIFLPEEWGGVNGAILLEDGSILAVAHRAYEDDDGRHYFGWLFILYPDTGMVKELGIVTESSDFPDGPARSDKLRFVFFSEGLDRIGDGWAYLYGGVRDAKSGRKLIPDPLL